MKTRESANNTDYIFYPIAYKNKALANIISINYLIGKDVSVWVIPVDKQKFLNGFGKSITAYFPNKIEFDVISVGIWAQWFRENNLITPYHGILTKTTAQVSDKSILVIKGTLLFSVGTHKEKVICARANFDDAMLEHNHFLE